MSRGRSNGWRRGTFTRILFFSIRRTPPTRNTKTRWSRSGNRRSLRLDGRVIVEHLRKRELPERVGELELARVVEQGDAALSFYRLALAARIK